MFYIHVGLCASDHLADLAHHGVEGGAELDQHSMSCQASMVGLWHSDVCWGMFEVPLLEKCWKQVIHTLLQSLGHEAWHVHHKTFEALSSWNLPRPSL